MGIDLIHVINRKFRYPDVIFINVINKQNIWVAMCQFDTRRNETIGYLGVSLIHVINKRKVLVLACRLNVSGRKEL